jgi:hypothetical protein
MSTIRTLVAALATAALVAPTAQAQPADIHAPLAMAHAATQKKQDLRSADARDAAVHPHGPGHAIVTPADVVNAPGATAADSQSRPGPAPVANVPDAGNGVDWTTIGLGIAGSLLAVCLLGAYTSRRSRRLQRLRVTA